MEEVGYVGHAGTVSGSYVIILIICCAHNYPPPTPAFQHHSTPRAKIQTTGRPEGPY